MSPIYGFLWAFPSKLYPKWGFLTPFITKRFGRILKKKKLFFNGWFYPPPPTPMLTALSFSWSGLLTVFTVLFEWPPEANFEVVVRKWMSMWWWAKIAKCTWNCSNLFKADIIYNYLLFWRKMKMCRLHLYVKNVFPKLCRIWL